VGYEASAAACFKRAGEIARSLNQMNLTADHLMLALIMEPAARRLLERVSDVSQLRETAMRRLGHYGSARNAGEQSSTTPTADLADIAKKARDAANEREQSVAVSDLVYAFPQVNGRLTYAAGEGDQAMSVLARIETGLVPKMTDSITKIETIVFDAVQQGQTVQKLLQDLGSKQLQDAEQRQRDFMDEVRRQVRVSIDTQVGAVLASFKDVMTKLEAKLEELKEERKPEPLPVAEAAPDVTPIVAIPQPEPQPVMSPPEPQAVVPPPVQEEAPKSKNPWGWLSLL
jgi:hypothetical protein